MIFPLVMFVAAGASFAFGIWQYLFAQSVQASSAHRMAYIMKTIEYSNASYAQKQDLYASITQGLPPAPKFFGIQISGSLAGSETGDACVNDGQRAICRALIDDQSDPAVVGAICGVCAPH